MLPKQSPLQMQSSTSKNLTSNKLFSDSNNNNKPNSSSGLNDNNNPSSKPTTQQQQQQHSHDHKENDEGTKKVGVFEIGRLIGSGPSSRVRLSLDVDTKAPYAIKIIAKNSAGLLPPSVVDDAAKKDIAAAKLLRHKYVVNLREVMQTERFLYFVNELVTGGELFDKLVVGNFLMMKRAVVSSSSSGGAGDMNNNNNLNEQQNNSSDSKNANNNNYYNTNEKQESTSGNNNNKNNTNSAGGISANNNNNNNNADSAATLFVNLQKEIVMPQEAIDAFLRQQTLLEQTGGLGGTLAAASRPPVLFSGMKPSSYPRFKEEAARKYFQQLIVALRFCHLNNIYHKNLKPENLLLDREGNLKISDISLTSLKLRYHNNQHLLPKLVSPADSNEKTKKLTVDRFGLVIEDNATTTATNNYSSTKNSNSGENSSNHQQPQAPSDEVDDSSASAGVPLTLGQSASLTRALDEERAIKEYESEKQIRTVLSLIGNIHFAAPEILLQKGYSSTISDVWSSGALLYLMLAGHHPFDDVNPKDLVKKIEKGQYFMSPTIPDGAKDLIKKILVVEPARRISMAEVVMHPWFQTNFDPKELEEGMLLSSALLTQQKAKAGGGGAGRTKSASIAQLNVQKMDEDEKMRLLTQMMVSSSAGGDATEGANRALEEQARSLEFIRQGEDAFVIARKLMLASLVSSPRVEAVAARAAQEAGVGGGGASFSPTAALRYVLLRIHFNEVSKIMSDTLANMMPNFKRPEAGSLEFRGYARAKHGLLTFQVVVARTVVPTLTLCEIKKGRGDFFDFIEFVSAVINSLGPARVASQEMIIRPPTVSKEE